MRIVLSVLLASLLAGRLTAQDSSFAAMQARGKMAMGVDQYTSQHHFEPLADGGRIMLQRDAADTAGTTAIREHLKDIAMRFRAGDFAIPGFVHAQQVPGTPVLAAKREAIRYVFHPLPGGGEVRIVTRDAAAVAAVHQFLAFQRTEHHVGQHSH
jgi:uncharacterized protein YjhX (UPF0386 family)